MQRQLYDLPLISDICLDSICDICLNENYFLFLWLPFTSVVREILRKLNFTTYYYDCILLLAIYLISSLHLSTFIVQCWFFTSWNNHPGCGLVRTISHHLTHLPPLFYFHLFTLFTQGFIPWFILTEMWIKTAYEKTWRRRHWGVRQNFELSTL